MKKVLSLLGLLLFLLYASISKTYASTLISDTPCSGSFSCEIITLQWSNTGQQCFTEGEEDFLEGKGVCESTTTTESRSCSNNAAGDCLISDTGCTATSGFAGCTFGDPDPPPSTYCGDGTCNGSETCATCEGDCGVCQGEDPPPPPDSCSGQCFSGISNCGEVGFVGASGTCSDGLCCESGGPLPCLYPNNPAGCTGIGVNLPYPPGTCNGGSYSGSQCVYDTQCADGSCDPYGWDPNVPDCRCQYSFTCCQTLTYQNNQCVCPCTPNCPVACGQANGCGGNCGTTDAGLPAAPVWVTPSADQQQLTPVGGQVFLDWSAVAKAESYQIQVFGSSSSNTYTTTNSYYYLPVAEPVYSIQVRAINDTCSYEAGPWSALWTILVGEEVTGYVYLDDKAGVSGDFCIGTPTALNGDEGILTVGLSDGSNTFSGMVGSAGGAYSINALGANDGRYSATLNGLEGAYVCACPSGCTYTGLDAPEAGVNFYLTEASDPWWQAQGGPVLSYASSGIGLRSYIPTTCSAPTCDPYLITQLDGANTSGFIWLNQGADFDLRFEAGNQETPIDEDGNDLAIQATPVVKRENYTYFWKLSRLPVTASSDFGTNGQAVSLSKPSADPVNTDAYTYFHQGDAVLDSDWSVAADESYIVLIDGDLQIEASTTVEEGGFLAFVVSGDITFDEELGHDDPALTAAVVEGVFVADGLLNWPSRGVAGGGDKKFVGAGTFVGWSGLAMDRDYDDGGSGSGNNNFYPTEFFRYRPDFLLNAPDGFERPMYSWREIAP